MLQAVNNNYDIRWTLYLQRENSLEIQTANKTRYIAVQQKNCNNELGLSWAKSKLS